MKSITKQSPRRFTKLAARPASVGAGITGALIAAASGPAAALPTAASAPAESDIGRRIAAIHERLTDPVTAHALAGKLKIARDDDLAQFANFNNWDNGWNNQGFNNY